MNSWLANSLSAKVCRLTILPHDHAAISNLMASRHFRAPQSVLIHEKRSIDLMLSAIAAGRR
jgi:hypothetical protein